MVAEEGSTFDMWQRGRQKIREFMKRKNGTTLVELIVTFALLGLFMTAATTMLTSSLQMFSRMQATSSAITVSDLILDKIAGEIVAADIPEKEEGNHNGYYFWLEPEIAAQNQKSHWVVFRNRSKSPIAIFAAPTTTAGEADTDRMGEGQLFIRYYAVSEEGQKEEPRVNQKAVEEIDWHFDQKVYMNYTIQDLWFSRDDAENHPNVVKINLILKHKQTGFEYSSYRYAENYNYDFGSGYMCARDEIEPGIISFPVEAEEFRIKGQNGETEDPEPKPEVTIYFVEHYIDNQMVLQEEFSAKEGDTVTAYPKDSTTSGFEGYQSITPSITFTVGKAGGDYRYRFEYEPIKMGNYKYTIRCHLDGSYQGNYTVQDSSGSYKGSGSTSGWELYRETRYADLEDNGKSEIPPVVAGYTPMSPTYTVKVDSTYNVLIDIPYKQNDVNVIIYSKCGDEILDKTILTGRYKSTISLNNHKSIPGYTRSTYHATIPVSQLEDVTYTFYYHSSGSAPFPPQGKETEIKYKINDVEFMPTDVHKELANQMWNFFMNGWHTVDGKKDQVGYKTFEYEGETYAIAGYVHNLENSNVNSEKKEIAQIAGVKEENLILLTDDDEGIKNKDDSKLLWLYLMSRVEGATPEDFTMIENGEDFELEFEKKSIDGKTRYYLEEASFEADKKTGIDMELEIKYK